MLCGLQVFPGIVDSDYTGEIKIMVSSPTIISMLSSGHCFAQLLFTPTTPY